MLSIQSNLILLKTSPQREEILVKTDKTLEESIELINEYLYFEKYSNTKFLKHSTIYLDNLINEIINELKPHFGRKNITLHKSLLKNTIIKTNKEWLKKALLNIINKLIKENNHLFIKIEKVKKGYLLIIKNTNIGIKKDKEEIINQNFINNKDINIEFIFAKSVIESLGGKIICESFPQKGKIIYIYLPKISKKIKLKRIILSLMFITLISFFTIDYFYCLIPQKIKIETFGNIKIIKLQNKIVAKTDINDNLKIIAYKNLFGTKFRNAFILKKADIEIATNGQKIKIFTPNTSFTNIGTNFETISSDKKTFISVYKGKIINKNILVNQNEGLIVSKTIKKLPLPQKISHLIIKNNPYLTISWSSPYNNFKILISKDKTFNNPPIYEYQTFQKYISPNLTDGIWYINIKAKYKNLFSLPITSKFLSLNNYYKALNYFNHNNIKEALEFIKKSIKTINKKSPAPYYLYVKILFNLKKYKQALKYIKIYEQIGDKEKMKFLKAQIYFKLNRYKKVITTLKNPISIKEKLLIAKAFYKLKDYKKANKYLYQILELTPKNKEALKLLKLPKELKGLLNESK